MRHTSLQAATIFLLVFGSHASAQTRPTSGATTQDARRASTQTQAESPTSADEDFELNIDERRINVGEYHAETALTAEGARGLHLNVGVALRASEIDVSLRNVRGHVRFRGSLDSVLRLLDTHRDAAPQNQPAPTPP